jgi:hypothetical protein
MIMSGITLCVFSSLELGPHAICSAKHHQARKMRLFLFIDGKNPSSQNRTPFRKFGVLLQCGVKGPQQFLLHSMWNYPDNASEDNRNHHKQRGVVAILYGRTQVLSEIDEHEFGILHRKWRRL